MSFVWPSASSVPLRCEDNVGLGNLLTQPFHGRRRHLLQASDVMTQDMWQDECTISSAPRGSVDVPCHHLDNSGLTTCRRANAWNLLVLRFSLFVSPGGEGGGRRFHLATLAAVATTVIPASIHTPQHHWKASDALAESSPYTGCTSTNGPSCLSCWLVLPISRAWNHRRIFRARFEL